MAQLNVEDRLARLERQLRRWQGIGGGLFVALVLLGFLYITNQQLVLAREENLQLKPQSGAIVATDYVIVGNPLGTRTVIKGGIIELWDRPTRAAAVSKIWEISAVPSNTDTNDPKAAPNPHLTLFDNDRRRLQIQIDPGNKETALELYDNNGVYHALISIDRDGTKPEIKGFK